MKPVLIAVFSTSCPACKAFIAQERDKLRKEIKQADLAEITVNGNWPIGAPAEIQNYLTAYPCFMLVERARFERGQDLQPTVFNAVLEGGQWRHLSLYPYSADSLLKWVDQVQTGPKSVILTQDGSNWGNCHTCRSY